MSRVFLPSRHFCLEQTVQSCNFEWSSLHWQRFTNMAEHQNHFASTISTIAAERTTHVDMWFHLWDLGRWFTRHQILLQCLLVLAQPTTVIYFEIFPGACEEGAELGHNQRCTTFCAAGYVPSVASLECYEPRTNSAQLLGVVFPWTSPGPRGRW